MLHETNETINEHESIGGIRQTFSIFPCPSTMLTVSKASML